MTCIPIATGMTEVGKSRGTELKQERPVIRKIILAIAWVVNFPYGTTGKKGGAKDDKKFS